MKDVRTFDLFSEVNFVLGVETNADRLLHGLVDIEIFLRQLRRCNTAALQTVLFFLLL